MIFKLMDQNSFFHKNRFAAKLLFFWFKIHIYLKTLCFSAPIIHLANAKIKSQDYFSIDFAFYLNVLMSGSNLKAILF